MSNEQALLNCTFGWGKTCRLYLDSIEIAGKSYDLNELTSIYPVYRNVFGVPSASLELAFGQRRLVLRGIPDLETARSMVSHLQLYCSDQPSVARARFRSNQSRQIARAQARAWERTSKMPAIPSSPAETSQPAAGISKTSSLSQLVSLVDATPFEPVDGEPLSSEPSLAPEPPFNSFEQLAHDLAAYQPEDPLPSSHHRPVHTPGLQPPLRSVHLVHPEQKSRLDSRSVPVPALKSSVLPVIHVPVRLQAGECAHYSIGATLCSDRLSGSERAPYPPLDHGLLILTNRRIFYTGKRSQLILAYTHLWYVSLLHNAIALHIEQQFRRIILELEHPEEWASRIEQLSFIARRARPRPELPTISMPALPGPRFATTLKRPAVKPPVVVEQAGPPAATIPLLPEQAESNIIEATTISLDEPEERQCAEMKTQDFPSRPLSEEITTEDLPQQPPLGEIATQELSGQPNLEERTTVDLSYGTAPLDGIARDIANQTTPLSGTTRDLSYETAPLDTDILEGDEVQTISFDEQLSACSSYEQRERAYEEIDTLPLHGENDDDEAPTISLRDRRLAQARTGEPGSPSSARRSKLEHTSPRTPRVRASHQRHYAGEERPG
jgi:hypothetical protein